MTERHELLDATDETIEDAVRFADPMVLRGLLYQLTGDASVAATEVHGRVLGLVEAMVLAHAVRRRAAPVQGGRLPEVAIGTAAPTTSPSARPTGCRRA